MKPIFYVEVGVSNRDGDATQAPQPAHDDETVMKGAPMNVPPATRQESPADHQSLVRTKLVTYCLHGPVCVNRAVQCG